MASTDSTPLRVMIVCPYSMSVFGGVQDQVLGLSRALRNRGVDARVVGPCDGPPPEPGVTVVGPTRGVVTNGSVAPIASGRAVAARTLEAIRVFEPDVVHLHEPLVPGPPQAALLGTPAPTVGTFHAAVAGEHPWYRAFRPPLTRWVRRLSVRTAVSEEARRLAEEAFGGTYRVLPNGVEVDRFAAAAPWPASRPAIFFVGRHEPRKGLDVLLSAFAGLEDEAELWVAGDGPDNEELRVGSPRGVEWLGRIPDEEKARRLRAATVACFPARHGESFGLVLLEAMAAGTAVVATTIPGYEAVARPDREALLVPPGDAAALRDALRALLRDPQRRQRLVDAGCRRADEFSMIRLAERFVPVYEEARASQGSRV
ncbi:MAG: glycosyltransferase family 4 protein [Acidimicrobiia bacterium]